MIKSIYVELRHKLQKQMAGDTEEQMTRQQRSE
jgi:hypothetical protein